MSIRKLVMPTLVGFIACLCTLSAQAQTKTITGKVTDARDGSALIGASVVVKGSKTGTQTGADGTFRITVPSSATTLVISSVGFGSLDVSIANTTNVSVSLNAVNNQLNDVVVVGYGSARKRDITGSVVSVKAKDFNQGAILSPDQLLQNKVAGLEITNQNGQPGAAPTIQIRGTTSVRSGNAPLYVVDGVALDGSTARPNINNGNTLGSTPSSNPLLFIDPNSIAQVEVLKDASSAAIYGSRGANGVIVITTKKGTAGPMKLDVGVNFGLNAGYMKRFEILDAGEFRSALGKYGVATAANDGGQSTDALKEITQTGFSQNYSIGISGGNEAGKYRIGLLGSHTDGFLKRSNLDKYLATIGTTYKMFDNKLTLDFNLIAGNYGELLTSVSNTAGSEGNIIASALQWNPTMPLRNAAGGFNYPANGSGNPLAFSEAYDDRSSVNSFLANISASYKITNNLEYKFLYGVNHGAGTRKFNLYGWIQGLAQVSGSGNAAIANANLLSQNFTHTLSYNAALSRDLNLNAVVGYEYFKRDYSGSSLAASGFNTNLAYDNRLNIPYTNIMSDANTQTPYTTYANPTSEIQSYFGRVTLNYKDKYVLNGSLRSDGSSKFGANNRTAYFPAVGARWQISNEKFMEDSRLFSNLSLRASYGLTGNQEFPAGSSQEQFSLSPFNSIVQTVNGSPDLKWETVKSTNLGLDFAFMKGRIYGSIDWYMRKTTDVLFQTIAIQPAPSSISFVNLPGAELKNSGLEFSIGATVIDKANVGLELNFNYAYNKNFVSNFIDPNTKLPVTVQTGFINGQGVSGTLAQVITNNQPVNVFVLKPFNGFDATGNQIIGGTATYAGDPNPRSILGFGGTLRYKKFSVVMNLGGSFGFLLYNNTATSVTNLSGIKNGRNVDKAAYNSGEGIGSGAGASTRFLEKGDYVKMRNLSVRYNVGNIGKYTKNFSVFVSASNLFVITGFSGFDPEVNIDKNNNSYPSRSIEYIPYPTPRVITFGVNCSL